MYIIKHDDILGLAAELKKSHDIYAPLVDPASGQVFFDLAESVSQVALDAEIPFMPPKEVLFPQIERILNYRYDDATKDVVLAKSYAQKPKALFGLRPCDLAGIQCLDRFYLGQEFVDDVYLTHRKQTFIVTNTCTTPFKQCFCVCTHTGPAADEGYDLNLTKLPDVYLVEVGSDKGRQLAQALGWKKADASHLKQKKIVVDKAISLFPAVATENKAWISRVMNRITTGFIKHEVWEHIGKQCFECGACSFVCPSCSCFNIEEGGSEEAGCDRFRTRDSCSFEGYSRMAGDHNPRKPVEDRRNKRFFCKLSYSQSKKYLRPGCVGCGRCAVVCPGDIGLPNVVTIIRREIGENHV